MPNYNELMAAFPETSRYVKLASDGDSFTGTFTGFGKPKTGGQYGTEYPALFDVDGEEKELTCRKALMQAFQRANVQDGETITITRGSEEGVDRETGQPTGQTYTRYEITRDGHAAPKAAPKKKEAAEEEIDIDDIPFK